MFISLLLLFATIWGPILSKNICNHSNLDNKMKLITMTLGDARSKWPENEEQKIKFCRDMYEATTHAKFFKKKCYHGISKSFMKFTIHALEYNNIKLTCKTPEEMKRFLNRGKCGNKGKKETAKCWTDWVNKLTMIKNVTQTADKVPLMCCSLNEWKKCSLDVYRGLGTKVCSKNNVDGFQNYMKRSIVDPFNIIFHCGDTDSKQCGQLSKLTSRGSKRKPKYKTPFPLILEISDSL